jgi:hypothetical protein
VNASEVFGRLLGALPLVGGLQNRFRRWDHRPVTSWFEHFIIVNWNAGDVEIERGLVSEERPAPSGPARQGSRHQLGRMDSTSRRPAT